MMAVQNVLGKARGLLLDSLLIHVILEALMINLLILKEVKCNSDSCLVSRQTMEVVPNCPTSETEWNEASRRKNCSAFASQCSEPDKLLYHCVINPFVNQTLEVCAYGMYIVLGYCTEYSYSGNFIQRNYDTKCSKFTQSLACPSGYYSTEAYKYPGCYELTKKSTVQNPTTAPSVPTSDTYVHVPTQNVSMVEEPDMDDVNLGLVIGITIEVIVILVAVTAVLCTQRKCKPISERPYLSALSVEYDENGQLMKKNGKAEERLMQIEP